MSKSQKVHIGALLFVAFVGMATFLALHPNLTGGPTSSRLTMDEDFSNDWVTADGNPVTLSTLDKLPGFREHGLTIHRQFPDYIEPGIELNFLTHNLTLHLYYDDEEVYAFVPDVETLGAPYATRFHFAPLSPANANMTVTMELAPAYPDSSSQILEVRLSGTAAYVQRYVQEHGLALLISLLVTFVGLSVLFLYAAVGRDENITVDLFSLGITTILLGIWSGAQTLVFQLVTGQSAAVRALEYMSLLFAQYPLVIFVGSFAYSEHRHTCSRIALAATGVVIAIITVGTACLGIDMHHLLTAIHALMLVSAVLIVYQIAERFVADGGRLSHLTEKVNWRIILGFLVFVICAVLDFVVFIVTQRGASDPAFFLRTGLLFFSVILAYEAFHACIVFVTRVNRADTVEQMALTDALTGIGNRSSWQLMCEQVASVLRDGDSEDALVCAFDVNFLKRVNDTYGHAAGDAHIRRAAETINRSFGVEGTCCRTGGDEFNALIVGQNLMERYEMCRALLETSLSEQRDTCEGDEPLSLALGFAMVSETDEQSVEAALELADQRMYEHKRAMKAERVD